MTGGADLHVHTTASDGTLTPAGMVARAAAAGLEAVGITDHDTVAGLPAAVAAGIDLGIMVIDGVELSCTVGRAEVHILGYLCNWEYEPLDSLMNSMRQARRARAEAAARQLAVAGYPIDIEAIIAGKGDSVGRPHLAQALVAGGYAQTVQQAFRQFLVRGKVGHVERQRLGLAAGIETILAAGGVPVVAHPALIRNDDLVQAAITAGARGLEVYHTDHTHRHTKHYAEWAQRAGLLATGGSDSHGDDGPRPVPPGHVRVEMSVVGKLLAAAGRS